MKMRQGLHFWLRQQGGTALTRTLLALTVAALLLPAGAAVGNRPALGINQPNPLIDPPDID
jgi:hypothetical protein